MKKQLVVTFTTFKGSRQYTLGQMARVVVLLVLVIFAASFFLSNWLLVEARDDLDTLSQTHQELATEYELMLGTQNFYQQELDSLAASLEAMVNQRQQVERERDSMKADRNRVLAERDELAKENIRMGELSASLAKIAVERDQLQAENTRIGELNLELDKDLSALSVGVTSLERVLNLPVTGERSDAYIDRLEVLASQRLFMLNSIPNGLPIQAVRISDKFGMRMHPIKKVRTLHAGIDYKAKIGTPVYATADGVVKLSGNRQSGYGKQIILQHNLGFSSSYNHLNKLLVKVGEFVHKGQKIAESGNTGRSTGPHLHYEIRFMDKPLDPAPFVTWNLANFDQIYNKVTGVKWASLKNLYPLNQSLQP